MFSQSQIKKLQQTIDQQLENSPLSKKMKASQIYNDKLQNTSKVNSIMQTSAIGSPGVITKKRSPSQKISQPKKQKQQSIVVVTPKNDQTKKAQQRQFLINQNRTLKEQTLSLIDQLKVLLAEVKPKKYGIGMRNDQEPQQLKIKKIAIANQVIKMAQLQTKISNQKRHLQIIHDQHTLTAQQSQIKILQIELQKLQKQKKGLVNVLKQQSKGIQQAQMPPELRQKFNNSKQQLERLKQQCKALQAKTLQNQRLLRKKHQKSVNQHEKLKKLQRVIKQNQQKLRKGTFNEKVVTMQMVAQIQSQISELESQKIISQKSWATKIANIQTELQMRKLQQEKKTIILRDKQKQARLNDLRIKELKKLSVSQTIQKRKVSMSGDQGNKPEALNQAPPGRKRNIMFLDNKNRETINETVQNSK